MGIRISVWLVVVACLASPWARGQQQEKSVTTSDRVAQLSRSLVIGSASHRAAAAAQLARLGNDALPALPRLYAAIYDMDAEVRLQSVQAIGRISQAPVESINRLLPVLVDPDEHVRYAAEWGIAKLAVRPIPREAVPRMMDAVQQACNRMAAREHHVGHRQVLEQVLLTLSQQGESLESAAEVLPAPPPPLPAALDDQPSSDEELPIPADPSQPAEEVSPSRLSLQARAYELGDLLEHLQIIEHLAPTNQQFAGSESEEERQSLRQKILKQSLLQSETLSTRYALHRWQSVAQELLAAIFEELAVERLPDWSVEVIEELAPASPQQVHKLVSILASRNNPSPVRAAAANALGRVSTEYALAIEALGARILDTGEERHFRTQCTSALGNLATQGAPCQDAFPILKHLLGDAQEEWMVVSAAGRGLAKADPTSRTTANDFVAAVQIRELAEYQLPGVFETLAPMGSAAEAMLPLVQLGLAAEDEWVREAAADAVCHLRGAARALAPELLAMLHDDREPDRIQTAAARALVAISPETIAHFGQELRFAEPRLQRQGLEILASLGPAAAPALEPCLELLQTADASQTRAAAALALGQMGRAAESGQEALVALVASEEESSLCAAYVMALANSGGWRPGTPVNARLIQQSSAVRAAVAYADFHTTGSTGLAALVEQLTQEPSPFAAQALMDIGQPAAEALQHEMCRQEAPRDARIVALETLVRISPAHHGALIDMLGDDVIGAACHAALCGLEPEDPWTYLESLVRTHGTTQSVTARQRIEEVLRLWAEGRGSGPGEDPLAFGSHLGSALVADLVPASAYSPATPRATGAYESGSLSAASPAWTFPLPLPQAEEQTAAPNAATPSQSMNESGETEHTGTPNERRQAELAEDALQPAQRQALVRMEATPPGPSEIAVFYGTNRARAAGRQASGLPGTVVLAWLAAAGLGLLLSIGLSRMIGRNRPRLAWAVLGLLMGLMTGGTWLGIPQFQRQLASQNGSTPVEYGGELSRELQLGRCLVSIPSNHQRGELEAPSIFRLEFERDPDKHLVLHTTTELEQADFFGELRTVMDERGPELLVFIHGYNVSFEEAALRTAQLAYDLEFAGAPVFYSWPSQDNWHQYRLDRKHIELSVPPIKQFLLQLAEQAGAERLHVIAHSMGNVGLTQALAEMETKQDAAGPMFNQVVLAAPDIDADIFKLRIAPKLADKAERCTLYTSDNDLALIASRYFNAGARLGETLLDGQALPGLDVIDASAVDTSLLGHSYYGNASLIGDIHELLHERALEQRRFVRRVQNNGAFKWFLATTEGAELHQEVGDTRFTPIPLR